MEAPQIGVMFPAYYIFNGLLSVLLVLHAIWTYFILKIAYKALFTNQVCGMSNHAETFMDCLKLYKRFNKPEAQVKGATDMNHMHGTSELRI